MTYKFITFPPGVDVSAKTLVREFVDPILHDVRNMFLTPFGSDRNGPGGCNFPIAATLAGVLDALNDLFPPASSTGAGDDFKDLVKAHYPPSGVSLERCRGATWRARSGRYIAALSRTRSVGSISALAKNWTISSGREKSRA